MYTHFRVSTLHIHSLLDFILRTTCEAGRKGVHISPIIFSNKVAKTQRVSMVCSRFQESKSPPTMTPVSFLGLFVPVACSPTPWLPAPSPCSLTTSSATQCHKPLVTTHAPQAASYSVWNKAKGIIEGKLEDTQPGCTQFRGNSAMQRGTAKSWRSYSPSRCLNSLTCGITIVPPPRKWGTD